MRHIVLVQTSNTPQLKFIKGIGSWGHMGDITINIWQPAKALSISSFYSVLQFGFHGPQYNYLDLSCFMHRPNPSTMITFSLFVLFFSLLSFIGHGDRRERENCYILQHFGLIVHLNLVVFFKRLIYENLLNSNRCGSSWVGHKGIKKF